MISRIDLIPAALIAIASVSAITIGLDPARATRAEAQQLQNAVAVAEAELNNALNAVRAGDHLLTEERARLERAPDANIEAVPINQRIAMLNNVATATNMEVVQFLPRYDDPERPERRATALSLELVGTFPDAVVFLATIETTIPGIWAQRLDIRRPNTNDRSQVTLNVELSWHNASAGVPSP